MDRRLKIAFVIKALSARGGGAERVLCEVSSALAKRGHAITVISYDSPDSRDFYDFDPAVHRVRLGIGNTVRPTHPAEGLKRMAALRTNIVNSKPDVTVGFMHSTYLPLGLSLIGTRFPVLGSDHIVYDHFRTRPLERALLRLAPWVCRSITAVSEAARQTFPKGLRRLMVVVPNPVSAKPENKADVRSAARMRLLSVGRLAAQKDHATLIEAFALNSREFPQWNLRIVGEGPLLNELSALADRLGIRDRVELPGPNPRISDEFAAAHLFAMPSRYESFGLVVAEALAHGLPVVGFTDCTGVNELVIPGRNGILIEPGQDRVSSLADGLGRLMREENRRTALAAAAPETVEALSSTSVAEVWEMLLLKWSRPRGCPLPVVS